jgi:hypothetical protein
MIALLLAAAPEPATIVFLLVDVAMLIGFSVAYDWEWRRKG